MADRKRVPRGAPDKDRILYYARPDSHGCWRWSANVSADGYPHVRGRDGRTWRAHRLSFMAWRGPIPDGLQLDHLCRVRDCVNPDHLEPVTPKVNTHRGQTIAAHHASVKHCPQGHEYTPENTYSSKRGERDCRICRRKRSTEWARRKRAISAPDGRRVGLVRIG